MFELKNWVGAMDKFRQTQTIYKKLSEAMSKEEQPTYLNMVDEIAPNIRFVFLLPSINLRSNNFKRPNITTIPKLFVVAE